jgi:hypothetical protein
MQMGLIPDRRSHIAYPISLTYQPDKRRLASASFTPSGGGCALYFFKRFAQKLHHLRMRVELFYFRLWALEPLGYVEY